MKETIKVLKPEDVPAENLEKSILNKDTISREEIRDYAKKIAEEYNDKDTSPEYKRLLILDMLGTGRIMRSIHEKKQHAEKGPKKFKRFTNIFGFGNFWEEYINDLDLAELSELSEEEVEGALKNIREALLEELSTHMDHEDFAIISKDIKNPEVEASESESGESTNMNRITQLIFARTKAQREQVYRTAEGYKTEPPAVKESLKHARELLADAQNKQIEETGSPHPGIVQEKYFDEETGEAIVEKLNLTDLSELTLTFSKPSLQEAHTLLNIFEQMTDTSIWLEKNGMMMEDIKPANIGLVKQGDNSYRALFHDLDGLHPVGTKDRAGLRPGGHYRPPEFGTKFELPATSTAEMVYQLGGSLASSFRIKFYSFKDHMSDPELTKLANFIQRMAAIDPEQRPTLEEAKKMIAHATSVLEEEPQEKIAA